MRGWVVEERRGESGCVVCGGTETAANVRFPRVFCQKERDASDRRVSGSRWGNVGRRESRSPKPPESIGRLDCSDQSPSPALRGQGCGRVARGDAIRATRAIRASDVVASAVALAPCTLPLAAAVAGAAAHAGPRRMRHSRSRSARLRAPTAPQGRFSGRPAWHARCHWSRAWASAPRQTPCRCLGETPSLCGE